jgi:hypothetical protein
MLKLSKERKRSLFFGLVITLIPLIALILFHLHRQQKVLKNQIPQGQHTEDMPPVTHSTKRVVIEFVDSLNGRPTYNVLFSDTSYMSSMYPEEIANSLNNGVWSYNEDLEIQ